MHLLETLAAFYFGCFFACLMACFAIGGKNLMEKTDDFPPIQILMPCVSLINSNIFRKKNTWNATSTHFCKFEMTPSSELLVIHTQWNGNPELLKFTKKIPKTSNMALKSDGSKEKSPQLSTSLTFRVMSCWFSGDRKPIHGNLDVVL